MSKNEKLENSVGKETKKRKKWPVVVTCVAVAAALVVGTLYFTEIRKNNAADSGVKVADKALMYEYCGRKADLPLMNGEIVTITAEDGEYIDFAGISPNRKKIAIQKDNGEIYITDPKQSEKKIIADNAKGVHILTDYGIVYEEEEDDIWHITCNYSFETGETVKYYVGSLDRSFQLSESGKYIAFHDGRTKNLYLLNEVTGESKEVAKVKKRIDSMYVGEDGQYMAWVGIGSDEEERNEVYVYKQNEVIKVCTYTKEHFIRNHEPYYVDVRVGKDNCFTVISSVYSDLMYVLDEKNKITTIDLAGHTPFRVYDENGCFEGLSNMDSFEGMYVTTLSVGDFSTMIGPVYTGGNASLYYVDKEGKEELVSDMPQKNVYFQDGKVYYLEGKEEQSEDGNLMCAQLNKHKVEKTEKVVEGIYAFSGIGLDGDKIICWKNHNEEEGAADLYILDGDGKLKMIDTNVDIGVYVNKDSTSVCYFKLSEDREAGYGDCYIYKYGDSEGKLVDKDVLVDSLESGLKVAGLLQRGAVYRGIIDENSFMYEKYKATTDEDSQSDYSDWYYYNGKESKLVVSDAYIREKAQ